MMIRTEAARRELTKATLFRYLPAEKQQQALDLLAEGAEWDAVAQQVNQWVEEGDWERHASESGTLERDDATAVTTD